MSDGFLRDKVTLNDRSFTGPALTIFKGQIFLAWSGVGNQQLNIMSSDNGINFGNKVTLNDTSIASPALATFRDRLYLAWTGTDSDHRLNVMSSADGRRFDNKVTLDDISFTAPAILEYNGRLYLTWSGVGNRQINVDSSADGRLFDRKVTLEETSIATPSLGILHAPLVYLLYLGWTGTDAGNHLNLIMIEPSGSTPASKRTLDETSFAGPSLLGYNRMLWMAWSGSGNRQLNFMNVAEQKLTADETSIAAPALSPERVAWTGTDSENHLNVARIAT